MSLKKGCIALVPVGKVPETALRIVVAQILAHFNLPADILSPLENPEYAFDMRRQQYNAGTIIKTLESMPFKQYGKVLAMLNVDIFIPIFTHVLGEAQEGGKYALASMFRLRKGPDGYNPSMSKILERLAKVALHELGHLFEVVHCADDKCIMHFSGNLQDLDAINLNFCSYCSKYLAESTQKDRKRYGNPGNDRPL